MSSAGVILGNIQVSISEIVNLPLLNNKRYPSYVAVKVGDQIQKSIDKEEAQPNYGFVCTFPVSSQRVNNIITVSVYYHRQIHEHRLAGSCDISIIKALQNSGQQHEQWIDLKAENGEITPISLHLGIRFDTQSTVQGIAQELKKAEAGLKDEPGLNLITTTPANFNLFVRRSTPVFELLATLQAIVTWQNRSTTLIALALYIFCSLYLQWVPALIPALALYRLATNYALKAKGTPVTTTNPYAAASLVQIQSNMRNIQNQMGMFCDMQEKWFTFQGECLSWTKPTTKLITMGLVGATVFLSIVPFRYVLLLAGIPIFSMGTPMGKAVLIYAAARLEWRWRLLETSRSQAASSTSSPMTDLRRDNEGHTGGAVEEVVMVQTYENQRWWLGSGWMAKMLPLERKAFSDESGTREWQKDAFTLPSEEWRWSGPWAVDKQLPAADAEGWQYGSANQWSKWHANPSSFDYVRRRRWVRTRVRDQKKTV